MRESKSEMDTSKTIKILSGNMTGDYWYAPAGESYHAKLFRDAGLTYLFDNQKGTGVLLFLLKKYWEWQRILTYG